MVDAEVLRRRLDALAEYLRLLAPFAEHERSHFATDPAIHHLAERYLHLACECALDIAHHLIADQGYEAPNSYRDSFKILARHEVLEEGLASRLQGWAGLRNVLVHADLDIDHGLTWDAITKDLDDLRQFATIAASFL